MEERMPDVETAFVALGPVVGGKPLGPRPLSLDAYSTGQVIPFSEYDLTVQEAKNALGGGRFETSPLDL
jgi:hypothetical protein